jgi:predicted PurR-regulated permease PerM
VQGAKTMMDRFNGFNSGRMNFFLLTIITVILFGAVLKVTSVVVVPFIISWFLAIVASPMVRFLEKHRVPRIISVAMALFLLFACLFFMGMILFSYGRSLLEVYPKYEARLSEIYIWIARFFELPYDEHLSFFDNIWGQIGIRNRVRVLTLSFSNAFFSFLKDAFMVSLFLVFFLLEAVFFIE